MAEKREMTAIEYLKEKSRMSKKCKIRCTDCPLSDRNNGMQIGCGLLQVEHPEKAVAIVQKWSEEHPQKTFLSDFLEKYPNAPISRKGFPGGVCPSDLGYTDEECISSTPFDDYCKECWDRPLEE